MLLQKQISTHDVKKEMLHFDSTMKEGWMDTFPFLRIAVPLFGILYFFFMCKLRRCDRGRREIDVWDWALEG